MQDPAIRELQTEDAEQLLLFLQETGGESDNLSYGAEGLPISVLAEQAYLQSVQADAHSVLLGAFVGDSLIGSGSLSALPRRMSHRAELSLSIRKAYWNQGSAAV